MVSNFAMQSHAREAWVPALDATVQLLLPAPRRDSVPCGDSPPARLASLSGASVLLLDNSKYHVAPVYDRLEQILLGRFGVERVIRHRKPDATRSAEQEWLELDPGQIQAVVSGIGD